MIESDNLNESNEEVNLVKLYGNEEVNLGESNENLEYNFQHEKLNLNLNLENTKIWNNVYQKMRDYLMKMGSKGMNGLFFSKDNKNINFDSSHYI